MGIVHQERARRWRLRAEESGGAVAFLGHYVGFLNTDGKTMSWLQRVQNLLPNGTHAVVIESDPVRVEIGAFGDRKGAIGRTNWPEVL